MKIQCPKCRKIIPPDQINVSTDFAYCPVCEHGYKLSENLQKKKPVSAEVLMNPPKGAWYRKEPDHVCIGASTRSPIAFFLVPFMLVWSGGSLGGIYGSQIVKGEFDLLASLFGIPFLLGSILFWAIALMAIWGKVEVTISHDSRVFTGIGKLGWTRRFDWFDVKSIKEVQTNTRQPSGNGHAILMEGATRLRFGMGLTEPRRYFMLTALQYLDSESRE